MTDKEILRTLGAQYMQAATLPIQRETMNLWKALNRGKMQRPMVVIDQMPWNELNYDGSLTCLVKDPFLRGIEQNLRMTLWKWNNCRVDMVLEPFITIPLAIHNSGYGVEVHEESLATSADSGVLSHAYQNQFETLEDVSKIKDLVITHDQAKSAEWLSIAQDIFAGIAPIRQEGIQFHLGVWDTLSMYMGVENIYYYLIDEPELLHALMNRMTESVLAGIRQANDLRIYADSANVCHCSYVYDDDFLPDFGAGKGPISQNGWAFGLAQLFSSVSPAVTKEFEIPYITRMAEQMGNLYYGCCDRLDDRLDLVLGLPHLRKVSCSPWSDREHFAEQIGPKIVMSNKPTPAFLATSSMEEDVVRADLQRTVDAAKRNNVNLELILKDISTTHRDPKRLTRWYEIAMEVVCG